ncbi:MAG: hypothetical protein HQ481_05625 [Alphaproteobacteria bacterium]|nr:hypothetical protein [Alphaproteobacteria bacterium]
MNRKLSHDDIRERILEMLNADECSVSHAEGDTIFKLSPTKIGQKKGKSVTIAEINKRIEYIGFELKKEEGKKRIYRKAPDRPAPHLSPQAEDNLTSKKVSARVSENHLVTFEKIAKGFQSKRAALERAIDLLAKEQGQDFEP